MDVNPIQADAAGHGRAGPDTSGPAPRDKSLPSNSSPAGPAVSVGKASCDDSLGPTFTAETPANLALAGDPPGPTADAVGNRRRRVWLPAALFIATCLSTFWVGTSEWDLLTTLSEPLAMLRAHWWQGAVFSGAVLSILMAHEMGHFLQAVRYGVPASLPYFIPMPITPLGTMGAVIALGGSQANRRQLFDIGITGPLAGLVIALPLTCWGLATATALPASIDAWLGGHFGNPLVFQIIEWCVRPADPPNARLIYYSNPLVMAGWIGMLVTGLNMVPVGQLDGGHVAYALFGKRAHWLARAVVLATVVFIIAAGQYGWTLIVGIVVLLGIRHPSTADDRVELGTTRTVLGWLSLSIPIWCLTPFPIVPH